MKYPTYVSGHKYKDTLSNRYFQRHLGTHDVKEKVENTVHWFASSQGMEPERVAQCMSIVDYKAKETQVAGRPIRYLEDFLHL
jgi:hypothetical protein